MLVRYGLTVVVPVGLVALVVLLSPSTIDPSKDQAPSAASDPDQGNGSSRGESTPTSTSETVDEHTPPPALSTPLQSETTVSTAPQPATTARPAEIERPRGRQPIFPIPATSNIAGFGERVERNETITDPKQLARSDLMADITANATHYLSQIPPLPDDVYLEAHAIREAFLRYNAEPTAEYNVPVYGTACIDTRDCHGVFEQLRTLDTGIGHIVVSLSFTEFNVQFHERLEQAEGVRDAAEASRPMDATVPKYMDIRWGPLMAPYNIPGAPVNWWWKDPLLRRCLLSPGDKPCLPDAGRMKAAWAAQRGLGPA
jgi:hypothetical protein